MIRETKYWISGFLLLILFARIIGAEGAFWSVHHFMHFPVFIILALFALFGIILYTNKGTKLLEKFDAKSKLWMILVLAGILFIVAPTASDAYGDARNTIKNFSNYNGDDSIGTLLGRIFSLDLFRLHSGEYFYLNLAKLVMKSIGTDAHQTFRMLAFVFGIGTVGVWGFYFKQLKQNKYFTLFCLLIGTLAFQNFHGHAEIYSASIFFNSFLLVFGILSIKVCNRYYLAIAGIALVFAIKSHFINWIGALFYLQIVLRYFLPENKLLAKIQEPKFQLTILAPLGLATILVVYHFILDLSASHYVSRNSEITANVFLPIVTQEIPYHRYGLLHLNHILDWMVNLIGWGAIPALTVLALFKNKMGFEFRMVLLPVLAYSLLFFFFNPILGMARDWDLFSIAAPFVIAIPLFQLSRAEVEINSISSVSKAILIMALFGMCRLTVEAVPSLQAKRLLNVGEHLHKTYYAGSVVPLTWGMRAYPDLEDEWFANKVMELEESSTTGTDTMMAHFLTQTGLELVDRKGNSINAANYFVKALTYAPGYEVAARNAAMQFMYIGDYSTGLYYAQELLKTAERLDYLQIAANCAIELKNNVLGIDYCRRILVIDPQNKTAQAVLGQLSQ